jgi:endonuclease/exonuclease/phosphatase family metal-dependent hydrolase
MPRGEQADIYQRIARTLNDFIGHFALTQENFGFKERVPGPVRLGLAFFIRKNILVRAVHDHFVVGQVNSVGDHRYSLPRNVQSATLETPRGPLTIAHFHGLLDDGHKYDTAARIAQFEEIRAFLHAIHNPKIFCGDLNVRPDTESIRMFERAGLRDLVREFEIPLTRNNNHAGLAQYNDPISDYLFVSPEIKVLKFEALPDEVSDHLPLALEFE